MKYKISYIKRGKEKQKEVDIKFVPNFVIRERAEIMSIAGMVYDASNDIKNLIAKSNKLIEDKPEGWKEEFDAFKENIKKLSEEIKEVTETDFFQRRFEVVKFLLIENGIDEKDELCTYNFWDRNVIPSELYNFLEQVISNEFKDSKPQKKSIQ